MKKFFIAIILLVPMLVYGQDSYFGINLGISQPKNDFGRSVSLKSSGYATSGFSIQFDGAYFPSSIAGIGGVIGFGSIYPDQDSYFKSFENYLSTNPTIQGLSIPPKEDFEISSGFWNYFNLMTGPEIAVGFGRFQAGVRAVGGVSILFYPRMEFSYQDTNDNINLLANGTNIALGYMYGGNFMFKLNRGSSIKISADYFSSKSKHKFSFDYEGIAGSFNDASKDDVKVEVLHVSLGLNYLF